MKENTLAKIFIKFFQTTLSVLHEMTGEEFKKDNIYTTSGDIKKGIFRIAFSIFGDIKTLVIFDVSEKFANEMTKEMMGTMLEEGDNLVENYKTTMQEIGNIISGNAMGALESIGLNCDITPPKTYMPDETILESHIVVGNIELSSDRFGNLGVVVVLDEIEDNTTSIIFNGLKISPFLDGKIVHDFFPNGIIFLNYYAPELFIKSLNYFPPKFAFVDIENSASKQEFEYILDHIKNTGNFPWYLLNGNETDRLKYQTTYPHCQFHLIPKLSDEFEIFEEIKKVLENHSISWYESHKNILIDSRNEPIMIEIQTKIGTLLTIPVKKISMDKLILDISQLQNINFVPQKILSNIHIKFEQQDILIIKSRITVLEENLVTLSLIHILETDISKLAFKIRDLIYCQNMD